MSKNQDRENGTKDLENIIKDKATIDGKQVYIDKDFDFEEELTASQIKDLQKAFTSFYRATHVNDNIKLISKTLKTTQTDLKNAYQKILLSYMPDDFKSTLREIRDNIAPLSELLAELEELEPHIRAELEKPEYKELTFEKILDFTPGELYQLSKDPDNLFSKALNAARKRAETIKAQQAGRDETHETKQRAKELNAIMELKGGNYVIFSDREWTDAFSPDRICEMGELAPGDIDEQTGRVMRVSLPQEMPALKATDINLIAMSLLSTITANSVDNFREEFVQDGKITFYVKGVLEQFTSDTRTLNNDQLNMDRKTAGAIHLEKIFKPLQNYVGIIDGSRYSVFNYYGYDAETDTMTIRTPYLYQLWTKNQGEYFNRKRNLEISQRDGKKEKKADRKPLEINSLLKGRAFQEHEITVEIAYYITNKMLQAGSKGEKILELKYKTIIDSCPRFKERIEEIQNRPVIDNTGKKINKTAQINSELRKISRAFELIQDENRSDVGLSFDIIDISPAKRKEPASKNGHAKFIVKAPTKSMLNDKITIVWKRLKNHEKTPEPQ